MVAAVAAVVEENIDFAESEVVGRIVDMGNPGISAGTAGTARSHIGPGTADIPRPHIGPGTAGTVRFGIDPDISDNVRSGTGSGTYSGRCWVVYTVQVHSIVVADMVVAPGIAQAERNSAAYTLSAEASIESILVGNFGQLSPSPMDYKLAAAPVRPPPGLGSFLSF